jgi:Family of unknown function (DUF5996)
MHGNEAWPELPLDAWKGTCEALHLRSQIVGKVRMALTPLVNHWWNVTLYVTSRGLTTSSMPVDGRAFEMDFDFIDHRLLIRSSDSRLEGLELKRASIADFYREFMERLERLDIKVRIWTMPNEIENAVPFDQDFELRDYDPFWVECFAQVLRQSDRVLKDFRARFIGKASPVHFFWGGFDMAVTRFSGRTAPPPQGKIPNVAPWVMQEAYSHEVSSCGFWPGNGGYGKAAFYSYAYPEPAGYAETSLLSAGAFYDRDLAQFILPYEEVARSVDPDALLLGFLQETYEAAARLGNWDRQTLERSRPAKLT